MSAGSVSNRGLGSPDSRPSNENSRRKKLPEEFDVPHQIALVPDSDGSTGTAVFEIYIKTTPKRLWEAITDPEMRAKYSFGVATNSDWTQGSTYSAGVPGVIEIAEGENVEVDPPNRLVQTMTALWSDEVKAVGPSRVTWEIRKVGDSCQLTVIHDQLPIDASGELYGGWPMILSGLKTLLETGEHLDTPGSLRYARAG